MRLILRSTIWLLVIGAALPLLAAPPKSVTPSKSKAKAADEGPTEIPAFPYLFLGLARDPSVHAELKLKTNQIDAVNAAIAEVDESFWQLRDIPVKTCGPQLDALQAKLSKGLQQEMTEAQWARFSQILLQGRSWHGLVSSDVVEQLRLSADQTTKLRNAIKESQKARESKEKELANANPTEREQARNRSRVSETDKITNILTTAQRLDYKKLLGEPFEFSQVIQVGCMAPEFRQVPAWINSDPVQLKDLRGKVVVVHFWAFECINCIRNLPHYESWQKKFRDRDFVIVGVHTPETETERQLDKLRQNLVERNIDYPVVADAAAENWKAWGNNMWPSVYLIDKQGRVRNWWYGELNWQGATGEEFLRKRIEELLTEK